MFRELNGVSGPFTTVQWQFHSSRGMCVFFLSTEESHDSCFCSCRCKLLCWEQGDPCRRACEHRREDCVLLHLQGWNMAHPPPGHLRASPPAQSNPQHTHRAPQRRGNQSRKRETVSQTRFDTLSWKIETRYLHLWDKNKMCYFFLTIWY